MCYQISIHCSNSLVYDQKKESFKQTELKRDGEIKELGQLPPVYVDDIYWLQEGLFQFLATVSFCAVSCSNIQRVSKVPQMDGTKFQSCQSLA